jgi:hypothetical protein
MELFEDLLFHYMLVLYLIKISRESIWCWALLCWDAFYYCFNLITDLFNLFISIFVEFWSCVSRILSISSKFSNLLKSKLSKYFLLVFWITLVSV